MGRRCCLRLAAATCRVQSDVLLQYDDVGELLAAHWTHVDDADGRLGAVNAHVGLEVALGGKGTPAESTAERAFAGVSTVVHQQRTATAERPQTDGALIGVELTRRLTRSQLLDVRGLSARVVDLHELLQWIHGCTVRRRR